MYMLRHDTDIDGLAVNKLLSEKEIKRNQHVESYADVARLFLVPKLAYIDSLSLMKGTYFQIVKKLDGICKRSGGKDH